MRLEGKRRVIAGSVIAIVGATLLSSMACGSLLGLNQEDDVTPPPPSPSSPSDGGVSSTGFVDLDANVARCSTTRAVQASDLFVTTNGSVDPNATCVREQPCALPKAFEKAAARAGTATTATPTVINLGPGTYESDVVLPAHTHVSGGWRADWTFECDQKLVVLQGRDDSRTVRVEQAADTKLVLLTVQTPLRPAKASETFYGVFAVGPLTDLTLENVAIGAGSGGAGNPGLPGVTGGDTPAGVCGDDNGNDGQNGESASPGAHAKCDVTGCRVQVGGRGLQGGEGRGGTQGDLGEQANGRKCNGGTSPNCTFANCSEFGARGKAGCGGSGGTGGSGGESGGGSFGVYAWEGAKVTVLGGLVASANGGAGGAGGLGGDGGPGTQGVVGDLTSSTCFATPACNADCQSDVVIFLNGGSPGGKGGNGGHGGRGGGGAGGLTFSIGSSIDAKIELKDVRAVFGAPGLGGPPNGVPGKAGERGP